jgi:hypothetical protein
MGTRPPPREAGAHVVNQQAPAAWQRHRPSEGVRLVPELVGLGADLAKPTTTQRALDRVYWDWELRWMGLMDSPAAFPCRTILLLRPKCLAGEGAFFGRRRWIVRHSFPCSNF